MHRKDIAAARYAYRWAGAAIYGGIVVGGIGVFMPLLPFTWMI